MTSHSWGISRKDLSPSHQDVPTRRLTSVTWSWPSKEPCLGSRGAALLSLPSHSCNLSGETGVLRGEPVTHISPAACQMQRCDRKGHDSKPEGPLVLSSYRYFEEQSSLLSSSPGKLLSPLLLIRSPYSESLESWGATYSEPMLQDQEEGQEEGSPQERPSFFCFIPGLAHSSPTHGRPEDTLPAFRNKSLTFPEPTDLRRQHL